MASFHLQIVTPDGLLFDDQAESIRVRTISGDVCILARHIDYVTALSQGEAHVTVDGKMKKAACLGGMLAVTAGEVRVVASAFEWAESIDLERAQNALERAQKTLDAQTASEEIEFARQALRRSQVRIQVAQ